LTVLDDPKISSASATKEELQL
jgi:pyruvate dehydrogenase E1 component alpha subunit